MQFLTCNSDVVPCPLADQVWRSTAEVVDPAGLGISPETIVQVYGIGFTATLMFFLIGYVIAVATGLVRQA